MTDADSDEARAARAAERRREQAAGERASVRAQLWQERSIWNGFLAACAPWGWAFDATFSYLIGLCTLGALAGALFVYFQFLGGSFVGFFDSLGPGSATWFPLVAIAFAIAVPFVLRAIARPAAERAADIEEAWLAALPFPRPALPVVARAYGASAGSHGGSRFRVSAYFDSETIPKERAEQLLEAASIPAEVSIHYSEELRIDMRVSGSYDFKVGRNLRLLFHDLAVGVLAPLHKETPIARVEMSS
jgi:hypothetical protein